MQYFIVSVQDKASPVQWCSGVSNHSMPQLATEATPPLSAQPPAEAAPHCPGKGSLKAFGHAVTEG